MRVIGGESRSRPLQGPSSPDTRPLSDRAREALFNIVVDRIDGGRVLDLFAGTGAVGVEALSRGAEAVTFVERGRDALHDIEENIRRVDGTDRATIHRGDVFAYLRRPAGGPFDLVFSGPPQWSDLWRTGLVAIDESPGLLAPGGIVVSQLDPEEDGEDPALERLERTDERTYGRVRLLFHAGREATRRRPPDRRRSP